jgi:hypothetical protein
VAAPAAFTGPPAGPFQSAGPENVPAVADLAAPTGVPLIPVPNPLIPPLALAVPAAAPSAGPPTTAFTKPVPLPVPNDVATPQAPAPVEPPAMRPPVSVEPDGEETSEPRSDGRPTWLIPAIGVAVAAVAGAVYLLFGGSSDSSSSAGAVPKGTPKVLAPAVSGAGAILAKTSPGGSTPVGPASSPPVGSLSAQTLALTGRTADGITAVTRYVVRSGGALEQGTALTFATPAAATAFAAGPHVPGSGWQASIYAPGISLWAHTVDGVQAVIVAKGATAFVLSAPSQRSVPELETWAKAIASA